MSIKIKDETIESNETIHSEFVFNSIKNEWVFLTKPIDWTNETSESIFSSFLIQFKILNQYKLKDEHIKTTIN